MLQLVHLLRYADATGATVCVPAFAKPWLELFDTSALERRFCLEWSACTHAQKLNPRDVFYGSILPGKLSQGPKPPAKCPSVEHSTCMPRMIYLRKHAAGPHPPVDDALRRRYPVGWDVTTEHVLDPRSTEIYGLIFGRSSPAMRASLAERFRALCRSPSDCAYSAMHFRPSRRDPFNAKIKAAQCDETVRTYCRRGELEIGPTDATAACEARNIPLCGMAPSYVGAELRKRACPLDRGHVFLATAETGAAVAALETELGANRFAEPSCDDWKLRFDGARCSSPTAGVALDVLTLAAAKPRCTLLNPASTFSIVVRYLHAALQERIVQHAFGGIYGNSSARRLAGERL